MSDTQRMSWNELGNHIHNVELAPDAVLLKIELMNFVRQHRAEPMSDGDVGLLLFIIGESLIAKDIEITDQEDGE